MKYKNIQGSFSLSLILISLLSITTCPLNGQVVRKKSLEIADYPLFGDLRFDKSTNNGRWVSFYMSSRNGKDTLFVKNTANHKKHSFACASNSAFVGSQHFAYTTKAGLHILNLESGKQKLIPSVTNYASSPFFNELIALAGSSTSEKHLLILDQYGDVKKKIAGAVSFKISPCGKKAVFVAKSDNLYSLGLLELENLDIIRWIVENSLNDFRTLTWEKQGRSLAFLNKNKKSSDKSLLFYYRADSKLLYTMDADKQPGFPTDKTIDNLGFRFQAITISDDLHSVFFGIAPILKKNDSDLEPNSKSGVEIWNGNDKWIYPMEQASGKFEKWPALAVWSPSTGEFMPISSTSLPEVMLAGNEQYAILSNPQAYEPQFEREGPRDYYLFNLRTKEKGLLLKKHPSNVEESPKPSPGGRYISYLRKNKCWIYNLQTKSHVEVKGYGVDESKHQQLFTVLGWTYYDQEIILSDHYDLWLAAPDGSYCKRITHGREKQIRFKVYESPSLAKGTTRNYDGSTSKVISLTTGLLLEAKGSDQKTGYFKWQKNSGETAIVYKDSYIDQLQVADGAAYVYREQKFDQSPTLIFLKGKTTSTLFQSNPQQVNYHWGRACLIEFGHLKDEKSKAILYYPASYDSTKKYPMIVKIYEKQSQDLYKFQNPSLENPGGFNPTVLTSQGYFVLCPDILSVKQHEGPSALAATVSAIKEIISRGLVYPDKIGLMGHSFGGYETNYIITQTDLFAAAVAGSAVNNIKGFYHTVNWSSGFPTMNYFKTGQLKMDQSPYEIPEIYARNSPIVYADKVTTPLLSYTGKADNHVDWHQSVEFYMALRRLNKKQIMLLYPEEGHVLLNAANQIDLSQRILQWFDYYLKDQKPAEWISKGIK